MKTGSVAFLLALGSCAAPPHNAQFQDPAVELVGASPGPAQPCIMLNQLDSLRISENDPHTLVYGHGKTTWANHLGQCAFHRDDILVIEPTGAQICRGDIVRSLDRNSQIPGPACVLADFVPYTR